MRLYLCNQARQRADEVPKVRRQAKALGLEMMARKKSKIRQSAKGENCTLNIVGVCNYNPETVVLCHFPSEQKGISIKSHDLSAGYGCSACHDVLDGRKQNLEFKNHAEFYMRRSSIRTHLRLIDKGLLVIK